MFLYGNMQSVGLVDHGRRFEGTYTAAFEDERITGVIAHYWNQYLVFQAPVHLGPLLEATVKASRRPVAGFIGPDDQVREAKQFMQVVQTDLKHDEAEELYSLALVDLRLPAILISREVRGRRARGDDLDLLTEWLSGLSVETLSEEDNSELRLRRRENAIKMIASGQTWMLEAKGQPIATSSFNAAVQDPDGAGIVQVGGVYTPPNLRGRGYARAVVAASLLAVRPESVARAVLFTGASNIPAQRAYAALGFRRIGIYRLTFFHEPVEPK